MKRNNASIQQGRRRRSGGKSRYAEKKARGQMYGPGCCAHDRTITETDRYEMRQLREENEGTRKRGWG